MRPSGLPSRRRCGGWDAVIGEDGGFVGMTTFGASGPIKDVYPHFHITADAVVDLAMKRHNA